MAGHGDEEVAAVASATKEGRATSDRAGYGFDRVFLRRIWKLQVRRGRRLQLKIVSQPDTHCILRLHTYTA